MFKMETVYQTKNPAYKRARAANQVGILVHSTGANNKYLKRYVDAPELTGVNQYNNHWNKAEANKCMHAFIGLDINKEPMVIQTLPYEYACSGCGKGSKGSYNYNPTAHIQFEICEGSATDADYYWNVIKTTEEYCAYLCRLYGWTSKNITSHVEAAKAGYASNHADPNSWMKHFGDNMDKFRARVDALLQKDSAEFSPVEEEEKLVMKYNYKVTGTRLAFRSKPVVSDATLITRIDTGTVIIGGDALANGWVPCEYEGKSGYCMEKYLEKVGTIATEPKPEAGELSDKEKLDILWAEYLKNK